MTTTRYPALQVEIWVETPDAYRHVTTVDGFTSTFEALAYYLRTRHIDDDATGERLAVEATGYSLTLLTYADEKAQTVVRTTRDSMTGAFEQGIAAMVATAA